MSNAHEMDSDEGGEVGKKILQWALSATLGVALAACAMSTGAKTRTVHFDSGDIRLAGTLMTPAGGSAKAAIVYVDGSGATRRNLRLARRFAEAGIAVLTYDKRGVGESQGEFFGPTSTNEVTLNALAADAAAAFMFLAAQDEVRGARLGFAGISQAGWVIPLAAVETEHEDFMVLWSGPVGRISEEDIFSLYTSDRDRADLPSFEEVVAQRRAPYQWPLELGDDVNSKDSLAQLGAPGLWVFGGRDGSIPVGLSISRLEDLRRDGHEYEYILISSAGHDTIEASFDVVADWIKRVGARQEADVASPETPLAEFVGIYALDDPSVTLAVSVDGDHLAVTSQGESLPAVRTGAEAFFMHAPGEGYFYFEFDRRANTLILNTQGREFTLERVSR
jgi:dienelactone hydrolase